MSYQKYHQILKFFLIITVVVVFIKILYFFNIILPEKSSLISNIFLFAFPISSLFFLFFSFYSFKQRITVPRKIESPSLYIILSILLLVVSIGVPVSNYNKLMRARNNHGVVQSVKDFANDVSLNPTSSPDQRQDAAMHFYRLTGKKIEYLNENGKKTIFVPSKADEEMYIKYKGIMDDLDQSLAQIRIKLFILLIFIFLSSTIFILFLRHTKKRPILSKDHR
jgi:hypothetical protein